MVDIYNQFKDFKSFEVVFVDKEQQLQKLFCTVKRIENNRIVLNANNQKNENVYAEVGDELKLHIYTENGIYSASSKVLLATKGIIGTEYIIAYPANSKHSQRREYFRADLIIDFNMNIASENKDETITISGKTKNICGKGMSFISDKPFPDYNTINLTLLFKEKQIETHASLVYSKPIVIDNRQRFVHAFTFTNISKMDIDFIVKKCFLHQLDLRKKQTI